MSRRHIRALIATVAVAVATVLSPASASATTPAQPYAETQHMVITGHGWGHGHGMSQYGARGAATKGLTYKQILAFYYPKTTSSSASGLVRVLIAEITNNILVVKPRSSLTARWRTHTAVWDLGKIRPDAELWRIVPTSGGRSVLQYLVKAVWTTYQPAVVAGELDFYANGGPINTLLPGTWRAYRGTVRAALPSATATTREIVNELPLEQYVPGVTPAEMPYSWPAEALKAQAVAARTYAVFERSTPAGGNYDVYDDTRSQVYRGFNAEQTSTNAAVTGTAGQILTYNGTAAFTEFGSSNGGFELASAQEQPYLPSQADPYEADSNNPHATWSASISIAQLLKECPQAGTGITSVTSQHYPPAVNPWISRVIVTGPSGSCTFFGYQFRVMNGLRSANFGFHIS